MNITEKEYSTKKNDGFWVTKNKKAINYNQNVAKPKLSRQIKGLAAENRRITKQNMRGKKKHKANQEYLKTFDHH